MKYYLLLILLLVVACTQTVAEVKSEKYVSKEVTVKGVADNTIKIGSVSGYTLTDKYGDSIIISSKSLPEDGKTVTAKGVLEKNNLLGYYINIE